MRPLREVADGQLVLVTGKGGVGKSTVAAAVAWQLADAGRRVLLLEVDPRESLHPLLGVAPSGGVAVPVTPALTLQSLRPRQVVDREIVERVPFGWIARQVLGSPIYRHFVDGAPGLEPLAVLEHLRRQLESGFDQVVVDAAATGHALAQLRAPRLVAEAVRSGPFARLAGRLAGLVADPRRTRAVLVTLAEEMAVEETGELAATLREEIGLEPALLVVNQLIPALPAPAAAPSPAVRLWGRRRELQQMQTRRLLGGWTGPWRELPWLALPEGPALVAALADRFGHEAEAGG